MIPVAGPTASLSSMSQSPAAYTLQEWVGGKLKTYTAEVQAFIRPNL